MYEQLKQFLINAFNLFSLLCERLLNISDSMLEKLLFKLNLSWVYWKYLNRRENMYETRFIPNLTKLVIERIREGKKAEEIHEEFATSSNISLKLKTAGEKYTDPIEKIVSDFSQEIIGKELYEKIISKRLNNQKELPTAITTMINTFAFDRNVNVANGKEYMKAMNMRLPKFNELKHLHL